jgi:hypothetical protein
VQEWSSIRAAPEALAAPFHHGQDSRVVGSLVAGLEHPHIPPTACCCHVGVREKCLRAVTQPQR